MSRNEDSSLFAGLSCLFGFISLAWIVFIAWAIFEIVTWITSK